MHATAPTYDGTDWNEILVLYDELLNVWPSPAVAVAMVNGPAAALREVEKLEPDTMLTGYLYTAAINADFLRRRGRHDEAVVAYRQAMELADNDAEQAFLAMRIAESASR